jgi:uncharacterized protein (DUF58 family)
MTGPATELSPTLSRDELLTRVRRLQIKARRLVRMLFLGEYHSVFRGRGIDFSDVREYLPGDDIRTIEWNVTARTGFPHVKKYVEERELAVYLLVDLSASSLFGTAGLTKRDLATELATLIAYAAIGNGDRVGLIAFTDRIEQYLRPRKSLHQPLRIARELIDLKPSGRGTNLAAAGDFLMKVARRPGVAFLISDFHARDYEASLRLAAQKHDLVAVSLTDPREQSLPRAGLLRLRDRETDAEVLIDTEDRRERERFAATAQRLAGERRRALRSLGVEEIALQTDRSYVEPLIAFFKSRARRRVATA